MNNQKQALLRMQDLLKLQRKLELNFGKNDYNIFVLRNYSHTTFNSKIDTARGLIYSVDLEKSKILKEYLSEEFSRLGMMCEFSIIDTTEPKAEYYEKVSSSVHLTDYYPGVLKEFMNECEKLAKE